jgi:hypothetical protein
VTNVRIPAQAVNLRHLHPQVTARALGGVSCTVSASAPSSPNPGDLWVNPASQYQLSQWNGYAWFAVPINAGSLTGENFIIGSTGQFHYASPPAFTTWGFESGIAGWTATNATASPSPAWSNSGDYSALLTYTSGTSWSFASPKQAVQVGNQVYVSATVYAPQALSAVGLQLAWYNSGGTLLSTSSQATAALAADTPTQLTFNAAPPSSAATCSIIVQDDETSVTGYQLFIDDVYIAGQLAVATAPSSGSDPLGNYHPPGLYTAGTYGTGLVMSTGNALEETPGATGVTATDPGPTQQLGTALWGPRMTGGTGFGDFAAVLMLSSQQGTAGTAIGVLSYTDSGGTDHVVAEWGAGGLNVAGPLNVSSGATTSASSLSGGVIITQVDNSFRTQTNPTSPSAMCEVWPIPEGDPVEGTAYRLSVPFTGTWQGNALTFNIAAFGQQIGSVTVGGDLMSAGADFGGDVVAKLIISQTGSSGILAGSVSVNIGVSTTSQLPTPGVNGAGGFAGASSVSGVSGIGDSNTSMTVQVSFASGDSGQSVKSIGSIFERIGGSA